LFCYLNIFLLFKQFKQIFVLLFKQFFCFVFKQFKQILLGIGSFPQKDIILVFSVDIRVGKVSVKSFIRNGKENKGLTGKCNRTLNVCCSCVSNGSVRFVLLYMGKFSIVLAKQYARNNLVCY
jgi:hypothetical protein